MFEPDLAALSLSLSRRRSLSSVGLDFPICASEMVVGKEVRQCVTCGMTSGHNTCLPLGTDKDRLSLGRGLPSLRPEEACLLPHCPQLQPRWSGLCCRRWHLYATFLGWVLLFCPTPGQPRLKLDLLLFAEKDCLGDPRLSLEHPQPCVLWAPLVWGSSPSLSCIAMLDF